MKIIFERFISYLFMVGIIGAFFLWILPDLTTKFLNTVGWYIGPLVVIALLVLAIRQKPKNPEK
jgi:hypothetical protein